jgi:cytochrome c oxidase subunit 2
MLTLATTLQRLLLASVVPRGTRSYVFQRIYIVFLLLGTVVGIVVLAYMLHKAYRYRASARDDDDGTDRPAVGELPTGGGGGRKLFVSFALSAVIVVSLITWTYFTLLYVENPEPTTDGEAVEVRVVGHQFYWEFVYPNGHSTTDTLRVPVDRRVELTVTSADVFHNFGSPDLRVKADAIPGQETTTWFRADDTGAYPVHCYELCGPAHSYMDATVQVLPPNDYRDWYADVSSENASATAGTNASAASLRGVSAGVA